MVTVLCLLFLYGSHILAASIITVQASRGQPVELVCNVSKIRVSQINWSNGRYRYAFKENETISTFSENVQIDPNYPPRLIILNFQENDTGSYTCDLNGIEGIRTATWNVTLKNYTEVNSPDLPSWRVNLIYAVSATGGPLLIFTSAICLAKICRSSNQDTGQGQTVRTAATVISLEEEGSPQDGSDDQYVERLNSLYDKER